MNIIVLSDGTGNSSAKLFKTNVWRLYEALDLRPDADQVAYYDNGVGTASFKPLALLGGAFGWGLKRNVRDLYMFLCRHYRPGDRIYAFGFSRGAFTIRVLLGLVQREGLLVGETGDELKRLASLAYRSYRARFNQTRGLVGPLRRLRSAIFRAFDRLRGRKPYERARKVHPEIEFVGLWDTVDAYGLPMDELTDGWDRWVWPLTLPTRLPGQRIKKACHAIALDDERHTFHPLLWDESNEDGNHTSKHLDEERISQVWFAGMHSNVGGGYPDDGMSCESLHWIATEATRRHLKLRPVPFVSAGDPLLAWRAQATPSAPMSDSRRGFAAYYRYNPRKVAALSDDAVARVTIARPKIHASVFQRLRAATDDYAPVVLPDRYAVVMDDGSIVNHGPFESAEQAGARAKSQEGAWNLVWFRRIVYFATILVTLALLSLPLWPDRWTDGLFRWSTPTWSSVVGSAGAILPGAAEPWLAHFREFPMQLLVFGGLAVLLSMYGTALKHRINDRMLDIWRRTQAGEAPPLTPLGARVHRFRTHPTYLATFSILKHTVVPHVFGLAMLAGLFYIGAVLLTRVAFDVTALRGAVCREGAPQPASAGGTWTVAFDSRSLCQPTGVAVTEGSTWEVTIALPPPGAWKDGDYDVPDVRGLQSRALPFLVGLPFRRHLSLDWFVPVVRVGDTGLEYYPILEKTSTIRPKKDGQLFLYVNDALPPCPGWDCLYRNNSGTATVTLRRVNER
jgi:uncharacterized protein (DUF2235 family)